ncbi:threonine aldolase family protein [Roseibium aggregatum]|uniref:L-threonine aldolase n=1 Tax=Roseibium aggregatum TaxID=187304 RepID=A0A926NZQ5_9HYPH|nr:low specificity L-threonine aldolase [Roseibium aggregatum]MBD1548429.1 low specificity L-threonine aldolase [Roseibium aggregatum]
MNFASDNWAGATEPVMAALARHQAGAVPSYGVDPLSKSVTDRLSEIFEREVAVFFVGTGSAANALALSAYTKPGAAFFCHPDAHIQVDECGCPEFFTGGGKLVSVPGENGKISVEALETAIAAFPEGVVHHGQAAAISITQATESGTVYSLDEIRAIKAVAVTRDLPLHMDGARFANALVSLGCSPADMTWRAGVDVLSFGATKNGCWCAEAVVFFDPESAKGFEYARKRAGHLFSKSRFIAAQFEGYLAGDNWLKTATHANRMAQKLADGIRDAGGRTAWPVEANELFPVLKKADAERLKAAGAFFYEWPASGVPAETGPKEDEVCLRLVTSFATTEADVERFLTHLAGT